MGKLILLLMFISCGDNIPFINVMEDWGKSKNKETYERLVGAKLKLCGEKSYHYSCTNAYPMARLLQPHEFFSWQCHNQYLACLESNTVKP